MRSIQTAAAALLLAACSRDLTIPERRTLALAPAFTSVAPREAVLFVASGGGGAYAYAFAEGGRLSGPDATIDPVTGAYQAGRLGSALDVIEVTDGAGNTATASVSVGPRLLVTPGVAATAPGGSVTFVASGGKPPYGFAMGAAPSGGSVGDVDGIYVAGTLGDVVDTVAVTDATGDPAAGASVDVLVTSPVRIYRGTSGAVAPLDAIAFSAFGGQPPYTFRFAAGSPASGGTIDAVSGLYRAGSTGDATDRVEVVDALGQVSAADVEVGPALALSTPGGTLRPGITVRLVATGGKPPYSFAYDPLLNRSGGTLDAATGDLTPGPNAGALDVVGVRDAAGAEDWLQLPPVGGVVLDAGRGVTRCAAADLSGDGRQDAVLLDFDQTTGEFRQLTTWFTPLGADPLRRVQWINPSRAQDRFVAWDFMRSGRDQLAFFGPEGFWTLVPDAAGNLTFGPSLPASLFFAAPNTSLRYPLAAMAVAGGTRIFTGATCTVPSKGILRLDWSTGASAPGATPTCEPLNWTNPIMFLVAKDMNGDGRTDLAWIEYDAASTISSGPVKVAFGQVDGSFSAPSTFAFQVAADRMSAPDASVAVAPGGLFLRIGYNVAFLRAGTGGGSPSWATGGWPYFPTGIQSFVSGLALRVEGADRIAAWDLYGHVVGVDVNGTTPSSATILPGTLPSGVACVAFPDLDGDGVRDAVASTYDTVETAVFMGDGDGGFGRRFRFAVDGAWNALGGDVTGDGIPDLVAATAAPGLRVLAGGAHQLAYGPETGVTSPVTAVAGGRVGPGGTRGVALIDQSGALRYAGISAGTVAPPSSVTSLWHGLATVEAALVTDLGSADARDDLFLVTRQGSDTFGYDYIVDEVLSGAPPTYVVGPWVNTAWKCAFLPVGTADAASACTTDRNSIALGRSTRSGSSLPAFATQTTFAGTGGVRASMSAAGRLADGSAVLVVAPSAPAAISATAVTVKPGFTWVTSALPGITEPVTGAALGDLDGDGVADLLVRSAGVVRTYLGVPAVPGTFADSGDSPVQVAGEILAVVPLAGGLAADAVAASGDQAIVLRNDGSGALR